MDEGGDSESCLGLTALSLIGPVHEAEKSAERLAQSIIEMFGLPDDFELHAVALLRDARLAPFQREFILQQGLQCIATLPNISVMSLYWDWHPDPPRRSGDPKAHRLRHLYCEMLDWLDREALSGDYVVAEIMYDRLSAQAHLEREHRNWVATNGGDRILVAPRFDDSKGLRLLQLADLAAHAAHLAARRRAPKTGSSSPTERTRRARKGRAGSRVHDEERAVEDPARLWYSQRLSGCFPTEVTHSGIRTLDSRDRLARGQEKARRGGRA
jgi:hypothetical protein